MVAENNIESSMFMGKAITLIGEKGNNHRTRPSRPIRCDLWIVERMRYPTNQPTDQPTDTASYRGALSHLKRRLISVTLTLIWPVVFIVDRCFSSLMSPTRLCKIFGISSISSVTCNCKEVSQLELYFVLW